MKFEISKSTKKGKLYFIARDTSGAVRLRGDSIKSLESSIEAYNLPKKKALAETKEDLQEDIQLYQAQLEAVSKQKKKLTKKKPPAGTKKKFLQNKLREEVVKQTQTPQTVTTASEVSEEEARLKEKLEAKEQALKKLEIESGTEKKKGFWDKFK
jgi:predicted transcriptional regulator